MNSGERHRGGVRTNQEPSILQTASQGTVINKSKCDRKKRFIKFFICDGCEAAGREVDSYLA